MKQGNFVILFLAFIFIFDSVTLYNNDIVKGIQFALYSKEKYITYTRKKSEYLSGTEHFKVLSFRCE